MAIRHTPSNIDLQKAIDSIRRKRVAVGYFDTARYAATGLPVAYIAAIQEMGSAAQGIPPRPTLHPSLTKAQNEIKAAMLQKMREGLRGEIQIDVGLELVGDLAASKVRAAIAELTAPPIKQATIAARARRHSKGLASNKPLVDTGTMIRSVASKVEDRQ